MLYNSAMETIYIDRLFVLNLIIDYLILLVTAKICGLYLRRRRYLISSAFGALYAALSVLPTLGFLTLAPVKLAAGIIMALIAYSCEERLFRPAVCFFGVSALFGGAVWALSLRSGGTAISYTVLPVSMPVLVLSFGIIYALLSLLFRQRVKAAERKVYEVAVVYGDRELKLRALHDSGNALYEPVTGRRVLIASPSVLSPIFPNESEIIKSADAASIAASPELAGRFLLIPYSAVGVSSGLLAAFKPDVISLDGRVRDDILVAVSPTDVSGDGFEGIL